MGIEKFRRPIHSPGAIISGVGSFGDLDVRSTVAFDSFTVAEVGSLGTINVSSTFTAFQVIGDDRFRGIATIAQSAFAITISAAAVSSGKAILLTPVTNSISGLKVNSIVDDTSFMGVTINDDPLDTATVISYLILE